MLIYIGADHRGFKLKESLKNFLKNKEYEVVDLGSDRYDKNDDYPDVARLVAERVSAASAELGGLSADQRGNKEARGILICGSGVGVDIVANKFRGVRSALIISSDQAYLSRLDDDTNILCLGADFLTESEAQKVVETWLKTPFSGEERHIRRLQKISDLEKELMR